MTTAIRSPYYGPAVRDFIDAGVPPDLIAQIATATAWDARSLVDSPRGGRRYTAPPTPGCAAPPGLGAAVAYGAFDLREWYARAPEAWGPGVDAGLIDQAQAAADLLRTVGEGSRVLWSLVALRPGEWRTHSRTALTIHSLEHYGPQLTSDDLERAGGLLLPEWTWAGGMGWRRQDKLGAGSTLHDYYKLHGAPVCSTTWYWEP
ncbi:hypothetical protein HNP11_004168 [Tsukamurella ocularis]|uniref:hypothetical protein n=1 Tax=Tsukamurella ocularis TaxID=1970234 RepID=UPI00216A87D9|nr:hypothetical protein [Tsukamurella ocularis]MCS3789970.1 hypothetical protein [Tsukamurella ocularis]